MGTMFIILFISLIFSYRRNAKEKNLEWSATQELSSISKIFGYAATTSISKMVENGWVPPPDQRFSKLKNRKVRMHWSVGYLKKLELSQPPIDV